MKGISLRGRVKWAWALLLSVMVIILMITPISQDIGLGVSRLMNTDVIVIDPGHGGMDGGASSNKGTTEKDINLRIAMYMKELAELDGWKVVMTRETDKSLHKKEEGTIRNQKTQDLIARRELIKETMPMVAVSIHLNSFKQDPSVRGADILSVGTGR